MVDLEYSLHLLALLVSGIVAWGVASYAWRYRIIPGALPLAGTALASLTWCLGNVLELASTDLNIKTFWAGVEYFGIAVLPISYFVFALHYLGYTRWLTRRNLILASIIPALTIIFFWTNSYHQLMWVNPRIEGSASITVVAKTYGIWFWVQWIYAYVCLGAGTFLIIRTSVTSPRLYRANRIVTVIGVMLPWVANALYVTKIFSIGSRDLTPAAFAFTGLATAWGLVRPKYLDMAPLARHMVIENMTDSLFVIDQQNNIIDINHAAERFLTLSASGVLGRPIEQVFANQPLLAEKIRNLAHGETEIQLEENEENKWYDLRISGLPNPKGQTFGRIITLRDMTQRKETEVELNRRLSESLALNRIIWAISAALDPNDMLQVTCRLLAQAFNLAHTAFAFWDDEKQTLQVAVEYYSTGNILQSNQSIPIPSNSDVAYSLRQNVPMVIPNAQLYALPEQAQDADRQRSMPSMLLTPVTANNRAIGAFCLDAPAFREITSDEVALTQNIALVIGAITRNTRFLSTERASAESAHPEAPLAKMNTEPVERVRQFTRDLARSQATTAASDPALAPGISESSHTFVLLGVSAFRQGDKAIACESFIEAIGHANNLLAQTPRSFSALDAKGIALCGLGLVGEHGRAPVQDAITAFRAARAINKDAGIVARVVRLLDALALAVPDGAELLAEARKAASGE